MGSQRVRQDWATNMHYWDIPAHSTVCDWNGEHHGAWREPCSRSTKQKERPVRGPSITTERFGSGPHHSFSPRCLRAREEEWTPSPKHLYPNKKIKAEEWVIVMPCKLPSMSGFLKLGVLCLINSFSIILKWAWSSHCHKQNVKCSKLGCSDTIAVRGPYALCYVFIVLNQASRPSANC